MKKLNILAIAVASFLTFTACEDDNDSNPVVQQPTTFQLNTPALADNLYDLEQTSSISLTCQQPDYGYTAAVMYYTQMSLTNEWKEATSVEADDATYVELDGSFTTCKLSMDAAAVNRNIVKLANYESDADVPADGVSLYVRSRAILASGYECYSNVIELKVLPYYVALTAADPELWYLIGGCIGDGSWGSEVGVAVFPMSPVEGGVYDAVTGQGPLTYTGYFPEGGGFKLVKTPGQWADQWGSSANNSIDSPVKNDGGSGDFKVTASGYYTINLDTKNDVLTITKAEEEPKVRDGICVSGDFNSWGNTAMTAVNQATPDNNHIWVIDLDATSGDTTLKFKLAPSELTGDGWGTNWGGTGFPFGWGTQNGANIPVAAGNYRVIFNDIDGYYHFFAK